MLNSIYGKISTIEFKPTFGDTETQKRFIEDVKEMYSKLSDDRFELHWNLRLQIDDNQVLDALNQEYYKRYAKK